MRVDTQKQPDKDGSAKDGFSAPASDAHPWVEMKKRKRREAHIAAYGEALFGTYNSLGSAHTPSGAAPRSSYELSHLNSAEQFDMSS